MPQAKLDNKHASLYSLITLHYTVQMQQLKVNKQMSFLKLTLTTAVDDLCQDVYGFFEFKDYLDNFISFTTLITKLGRVAVYKRLDYGGTERGEDVFSAAGQLH